jgi:hypothetical protein
MIQFLYVDPGSGFLLAQLIAASAGIFLAFKNRIILFFKSKKNKNHDN